MKIGEIMPVDEDITLNANHPVMTIKVANIGDRPIQVGSHYHFFEVNKLLVFDRPKVYGYRLDIPSGTSIRFEPGEEKEVPLVSIGGRKRVYGLNDLTLGLANEATLDCSMERAREKKMLKEVAAK